MFHAVQRFLFQNLPDQVHCYFMTECKGLDGVIVSSIPFTHPSQVPKILNWIRQQAVFNFLVSSVVRPFSKQGQLFSGKKFKAVSIKFFFFFFTSRH